MDDREKQKLNEIAEGVRETNTRIEVIDERTKTMDGRMDRMQSQIHNNADDIDTLQSKVNKHKTILGGIATGLSAILLWSADKIARFF